MEYTCYIIKRKNKASVSGGYTVGEGQSRQIWGWRETEDLFHVALISRLRKLDTNLNMIGIAGSNLICLTFTHNNWLVASAAKVETRKCTFAIT